MSRGSWLVSLASALLLLTLVVRANEAQAPITAPTSTIAPALAAQAPGTGHPSSADYLGSASCARCHDVEHMQWKNSLHVKMTKPVGEALIVGDFRNGT